MSKKNISKEDYLELLKEQLKNGKEKGSFDYPLYALVQMGSKHLQNTPYRDCSMDDDEVDDVNEYYINEYSQTRLYNKKNGELLKGIISYLK